jgi:hypothetical protein
METQITDGKYKNMIPQLIGIASLIIIFSFTLGYFLGIEYVRELLINSK